jgi:hypothetical protein
LAASMSALRTCAHLRQPPQPPHQAHITLQSPPEQRGASAYVSIRQHTPALHSPPEQQGAFPLSNQYLYFCTRKARKLCTWQHNSTTNLHSECSRAAGGVCLSHPNTCQHASEYVSMRRHTLAHVSTRQQVAFVSATLTPVSMRRNTSACVGIR